MADVFSFILVLEEAVDAVANSFNHSRCIATDDVRLRQIEGDRPASDVGVDRIDRNGMDTNQ